MAPLFAYLAHGRYFAQCSRGTDELLEAELLELGVKPQQRTRSGVHFGADRRGLYTAVYCSRLASRILAPLASFACPDEEQLYRVGLEVEWEALLSPEQTFAVSAHVSGSRITHSHYAALKLKDAIVDRFRKVRGERPSVDRQEPDVEINLHIQDDEATVSLDASGGPLHRRGYRLEGGEAPLQETLAAAVIRLSDWRGERPLYDPMCGSGTLLAEALMAACQMPAASLRTHFGFAQLPDFDRNLWKEIKEACQKKIKELPEGLIAGSDLDNAVLRAAKSNLSRLPHGGRVALEQRDFRDLAGFENKTIVCNLPYGVRLGEKGELTGLYREFGDFLKKRCQGATAYLLCGSLDLIPAIGLKPARRIPLWNGPIECRLLKFEIY